MTNSYGIKSPSVFAKLPSFDSAAFHGLDELHLFSNIAKEIFSFISPKYCETYKYNGCESQYPFSLTKQQFHEIKLCMDESRKFIPASSFKGSWLAIELNSTKSLYRSADWLDFIVYCLPTLIASQYENNQVTTALLNLSRGIALSLQFNISEKNIQEIER